MKNTVFAIATIRPWNIQIAEQFIRDHPDWKIHLITEKGGLKESFLEEIQPLYIFFPHWSWLIPREIYSRWECVVFHMTDLPFGRGGSPLQNLLSRGIYHTKISALRVTDGVDEGPIYLKRDLDLSEGSAEEIYRRAAEIVFREMIPEIIKNRPVPTAQEGKGIYFPRRKPQESAITQGLSAQQLYDHIRMLDAEGYPKAFLQCHGYRMEFSKAELLKNKVVQALVRIHLEAESDD